jgi:hypothetical protein
MERRTRREHFSSAALSITDDLLHRNILLLRATCGLMHCSKFGEDSTSSAGTSGVVDEVKIARTLRVTDPINLVGRAHPEF